MFITKTTSPTINTCATKYLSFLICTSSTTTTTTTSALRYYEASCIKIP